jgi:hypothetical protein
VESALTLAKKNKTMDIVLQLRGIPILESFKCPITAEIMRDPVMADDGHTYERDAIGKWFSGGHDTSPMTREVVTNRLVSNLLIKQAIEEYVFGGTQ